MKGGPFKLNMHPKEYFDRNPFYDDGKGRKHHSRSDERSKSAPSDRKVFKYSSPGKSVCFISYARISTNHFTEIFFYLAWW